MLYPDELRALIVIGRGGEIRTPDILLPKQTRYQAALHPEKPSLGQTSRILPNVFPEVNWFRKFFHDYF